MLSSLILAIWLTIFAALTWHHRRWGVVLLCALFPTYLIRFYVGSLPVTLLESMLLLFFFIVLIRDSKDIWRNHYTIKERFIEEKWLVGLLSLFLISATLSVFTAVDIRSALGEWKAFYIEPICLFLILHFFLFQQSSEKKSLLKQVSIALVLSGFITSVLAIYQHFTGFYVPDAFWANGDSYRVTGWYGFPNGVGLFLAPLIPLALYLLIEESDLLIDRISIQRNISSWSIIILSLLSIPAMLLAIFFAKSTGGLVAVAASIILLLVVFEKTRLITFIASIIIGIVFLFLPMQHPIKQELLFQDFSGQIRVQMWQDTTAFLQDHWLLGAGLASYEERMTPYHSPVRGRVIEQYHHPHNLFLTIWVNTGLTGVIAFVMVLGLLFFQLLRYLEEERRPFPRETSFFILSFFALLITGFVDSPYVKNDLALLFWVLIWGIMIPIQRNEIN